MYIIRNSTVLSPISEYLTPIFPYEINKWLLCCELSIHLVVVKRNYYLNYKKIKTHA